MKKSRFGLVIILVVGLAVFLAGYLFFASGKKETVAFEELVANPGQYAGKQVCTQGVYVSGFEIKALGKDTYQEGEVVYLQKPAIWVQGATVDSSRNCFETSLATFCTVRICGLFEHGDSYGHLGEYQYQLKGL
jgi:hypothetical protein